MDNSFDSNIPIYMQIMDSIKHDIITYKLKPGDKIPSVRDLAISLKVNPNTVQKSMYELEREGYIYANRTSGRFVSDNSTLFEETRNKLFSDKLDEIISLAKDYGIDKEGLIKFIEMREF